MKNSDTLLGASAMMMPHGANLSESGTIQKLTCGMSARTRVGSQ